MVNYKVRLSVKELTHHKCNTTAVLKTMITEIKQRMPFLKLDYAFINSDVADRIQFMLLFTFTGKGGGDNMKKYLVFIANTFSYYSLEAFDMCRERGKLDEWFEDFQDKPVTYPENFVRDMINDSDGKLSWSKSNPDTYWKNPKNARDVAYQLDKYATVYHSLAGKTR